MALVKKYGKVFGYFDGRNPNLFITDVEMIKAMYVKDFDHFVDRRVRGKYVNWITYSLKLEFFIFQSFELKTKVMRKWLALLNGQEWKDIRSSVTPAFTSGKINRVISH